jgi:hypothetical protein
MFRRRRPAEAPPDLRCSFCNKSQRDVRKLIAGPSVFICDECVQVCTDILADDDRFESSRPVADGASEWSAAASCNLCRMPVLLEEAVRVEDRAILCRSCVAAVQDAAGPEELH